MRPGGHCSGGPNGAKSALHDPQNANKDKTSPMETLNTYRGGPDESGHFGIFGGRFVAETLMPLILDVERAYNAARKGASFQADYDYRSAERRGGKEGVSTGSARVSQYY